MVFRESVKTSRLFSDRIFQRTSNYFTENDLSKLKSRHFYIHPFGTYECLDCQSEIYGTDLIEADDGDQNNKEENHDNGFFVWPTCPYCGSYLITGEWTN